jgi:hypothetical protein
MKKAGTRTTKGLTAAMQTSDAAANLLQTALEPAALEPEELKDVRIWKVRASEAAGGAHRSTPLCTRAMQAMS